jgi:hypothetical protein
MRLTVSEETFNREYENQEPHGEGRVWSDAAIDYMFDKTLGEFKGKVGEVCCIQKPHPELSFYHAADWAKKQDSTILTTFQKRPGDMPDIMVNWLRLEKMPWPVMVGKFNEIVKDYGGASAHDMTGVGGVVDDMLDHKSTGIDFAKRKLVWDILEDYVVAIERGEIKAPYIEHAYYEHKYATRDQLFGTAHLPDSICSAALAWHVRRKGMFSFLMGRV